MDSKKIESLVRELELFKGRSEALAISFEKYKKDKDQLYEFCTMLNESMAQNQITSNLCCKG